MLIEKKEIDTKAAAPLLKKLENASKRDHVVSLGKFVAENCGVFARSEKNVREIYEYLKAGGLDVGTYHSFRSSCYRAGLRRRSKRALTMPEKRTGSSGTEAVRTSSRVEGREGTKEHRGGKGRLTSALPPVYLPGGVEAIIAPETGAKRFEIKSGKESESESV
jgi:hypothetical protein